MNAPLAPIITVSARDHDLDLGHQLCTRLGRKFFSTADRKELRHLLLDHPSSIILWDADHPHAHDKMHPQSIGSIHQVLRDVGLAKNVFAMTTDAIHSEAPLARLEGYQHHLFRRDQESTGELLAPLIGAFSNPYPFGLDRYFAPGTPIKQLQIHQASQRPTAVQAMQNVLEKNGLLSRISALVAQATDELLLNALFDAPVDESGQHIRKNLDRNSNITLAPEETINLSIGYSEKYMGVSVSDCYGSLSSETLHSFVRNNYRQESFSIDQHRNKGLGLYGIVQSGLSVVFVTQPKSRTEVFLFFPMVKTFREYRAKFRLIGLLGGL